MVVHNVGSGLATVFPDLDGKKINDAFLLARPLVEFTWNMVSPILVALQTISQGIFYCVRILLLKM